MTAPRILAFAGSARAGSFNGKLLAVAVQAARGLGAEVTLLDLHGLGLPLYHAEIEAAGMPAGALELRRLLATHAALLLASPEYNGFPTPLLINSLDWASRPAAADGLPSGLGVMGGKVAGVMSASPGPLGGLRSLGFARQFLHNTLGFLVVPEQFALVQAGKAFDEQGALIDAKQMQSVQRVVASVVRVAGALKG